MAYTIQDITETGSIAAHYSLQGGSGTSGEASQAEGQTFIAGATYALSRADVFMGTTQGSPADNVYIDIATSISGAALGTSGTIAAANIVQGGYNTFLFSTPVQLAKGTGYNIRIFRDGARDATNYYFVEGGFDSSPQGWRRDNNSWTQFSNAFFIKTYSTDTRPNIFGNYEPYVKTGNMSRNERAT